MKSLLLRTQERVWKFNSNKNFLKSIYEIELNKLMMMVMMGCYEDLGQGVIILGVNLNIFSKKSKFF